MLAWLPDDQLEEVLHSLDFVAYAPNTITNRDEFRKELERVRQQGYAEDCEESTVGIRCVGAPIMDDRGTVVAAMSITSLSAQIDEARLQTNIQIVKNHARQLSAELGYVEEKLTPA